MANKMVNDKELAATQKQLKIKAGVVKRLLKEYNLYKIEAEEQKRTVDKYIADGKDEYDVRNQQKILAEAEKMIPDTQKRLGTAVEQLRDIIVASRSTLGSDEELVKAEEILEEANI
ncbi:hypothetical protein Clacol_004058 [Clathrus columnatus]|uniref:Tubulin-specific chaperone A n=1 Tax=Clathrus columnatus TaxID=1419009 RepID=A0AAV5AAU7_9AGAM|nr:hypothetical protein Clacol_004058 [Clathrus columnatus]